MAILKKYYENPTKKRCRKIGDAILYGCGAIGATGLIGFDQLKDLYGPKVLKTIIGGVLILGFIGKFMSNFCKEEKKDVERNGEEEKA